MADDTAISATCTSLLPLVLSPFKAATKPILRLFVAVEVLSESTIPPNCIQLPQLDGWKITLSCVPVADMLPQNRPVPLVIHGSEP